MVVKYGIDNLKAIAGATAEVLSIGSKVLKGNVLAAFQLLGPVQTLRGVDFSQVDEELGDLDAAERLQVQDAFNAKLSLEDKNVEAKIKTAVGYLEEAIGLVGEGVEIGTKALDLLKRVRLLIGV